MASEDFEHGASNWELMDPNGWRVDEVDGRKVFNQFQKKPEYKPPHRSPFHVALLKSPAVTDFELTARVRNTGADVPHRDVCLIFGYQDPARFYYAHLGRTTDPHSHQIMIVNRADRASITASNNQGAPWTDGWHTVKVVRDAEQGTIEVFWNDEPEPAMTAQDKTFAWGRIGIGSFDDTAEWDRVELRGVVRDASE